MAAGPTPRQIRRFDFVKLIVFLSLAALLIASLLLQEQTALGWAA